MLSPVVAVKRASIAEPNESKEPAGGLRHAMAVFELPFPLLLPSVLSVRPERGTPSSSAFVVSATASAAAAAASQIALVVRLGLVHEPKVPEKRRMPTTAKSS